MSIGEHNIKSELRNEDINRGNAYPITWAQKPLQTAKRSVAAEA